MKNRFTCFLLACLSLTGASSFAQTSHSIAFTGADQYVSIPHNNVFNVTAAFTVEAWINTSSGSTRQVIAAKMFPTQDTWLFELQPNSGGVKLNFYTHTGSGSDHLGSSLIAANRWYHVAATFDGSTVRLYINGVLDASLPQTGNLSTNSQPVRIGAWGAVWGGGDERRFTGRIDEVRFWNIARTPQQIKAGMFGVDANSTGLIAWYRMNEGTAANTANSSPSGGLDGTLTNGATWASSPVQYSSNALDFDGNDYVDIPYSTSFDMTNTLTLEAWVYPTTGNWMNIVMKGDYGYALSLSGSAGLDGCNTGSKLVYWDQNNCGPSIRSSLSYSLNAWHHVAVSVEDIGSQLRIYFYLDGVEDGPYFSNTSAISNGGASSHVYLGRQGATCACNYVTGILDEVRIWNTLRTASDIQAFKDVTLTGAETGLVALYSFNEGIAGGDNTGLVTTTDATANNNHGTLTGFTLTGTSSNRVAHTLTPLPVELTAFSALVQQQSIRLTWQTAQEQNSRYFDIERSADGAHFTSIGQVPAAGSSTSPRQYAFTDPAPVSGINYYRLQQTDLDGKWTYSKVLTVKLTGKRQFRLLNNTATGNLTGTFYSETSGRLQVTVITTTGQLVYSKMIPIQSGNNLLQLPVQHLATGLYFISLNTSRYKQMILFSKQ